MSIFAVFCFVSGVNLSSLFWSGLFDITCFILKKTETICERSIVMYVVIRLPTTQWQYGNSIDQKRRNCRFFFSLFRSSFSPRVKYNFKKNMNTFTCNVRQYFALGVKNERTIHGFLSPNTNFHIIFFVIDTMKNS
jgi:hypothetical protein